MQLEELETLVIDTLEDMKAHDIQIIDVRGKTSITDVMILASGTSTTHAKSLAETVVFSASPANSEEKRRLIEALQQTSGNQSQAARILGINRVTVWNRMRKYGIDLKKVLTA